MSVQSSMSLGMTADAFVIRHLENGSFRGWLILAECFQMPHYLLSQIYNLTRLGSAA